MENRLAFIGTGIIAGVWMERLLSTGAAVPEQIMACDIRPERLEQLQQQFGVRTSVNNTDGATFAQAVVLATPPTEVLPVIREIRPALGLEHVVVSLAAGVSLATLERELGAVPAVRVMPNTPALVGEAMNLVAYGTSVSERNRAAIERLLDLFGQWFEVPDRKMDDWCALCAVGPTYVYPVIEALAAAAAARGLPRDQALRAAAQVVAGAAHMVLSTKKEPAELKQMISLRTVREDEVQKLFTQAYRDAVQKLQGLAQRLAEAA